MKDKFSWVYFAIGLVFIILGIATLFVPRVTLSSLFMVIKVAMILTGAVEVFIFYIKRLRHDETHTMGTPFMGIAYILAGIILFASPFSGEWITSFIFAALFVYQFMYRIARFGLMNEVRDKAGYVALICLNIIGLMFGLVLLFSPMLFTISLESLIALGLMIFGISSVIEIFWDNGNPKKKLIFKE